MLHPAFLMQSFQIVFFIMSMRSNFSFLVGFGDKKLQHNCDEEIELGSSFEYH